MDPRCQYGDTVTQRANSLYACTGSKHYSDTTYGSTGTIPYAGVERCANAVR